MKKRKIVLLLVVVMATSAWAQTVVQESLDWSKLRFRPTVSMTAPLAKENDPVLPMAVNLDAYYEFGKVADFNAGFQLGTFTGINVGGTLHLKDAIVNRNTRFIVAQTGRRTYFYKGRSEYRSVFGATANLQLGNYSETGFYGRMSAGINFERMSRAYYDGYGSARNGYSSVKLQAVVVKLNQFEYGVVDQLYSRVGVGAVAGYTAELKPWKHITLFADGELGYLSLLGVKDYDTGYVVMNNNTWNLLLALKLGASIHF